MVVFKRLLFLFIATVMMFSLAGCNSAGEASERVPATESPDTNIKEPFENHITAGGTVNISVGPYDTLNPLITNNEDIRVYMGLIYENLVRIDEQQRPQPALFDSWYCNEACTVWEFVLKEGVTFHDGTSVDAESVKVLIDYVISNGGNYSENVKNIAGCFAKDTRTVQFVLHEADSMMPSKMGIPLLSSKTLSDKNADSKPVGAGMYFFESKTENVISLKKNEDFYCDERKPNFDGVKITVYSSEYEKYGSDFDIAFFYGGNTASYVFDENTRIIDYTGKICSYLAVNCSLNYTVKTIDEKDPKNIIYTEIPNPLADTRLRQVISLLTDRTKICNAAAGDGVTVMLPAYRGTAFWNNRVNVAEQNVDEAVRLLKEAGYSKSEVDGKWYYRDGTKLIIEALSPVDDFELRILMQNFKHCMEDAGISVNLKELSNEEFNIEYADGQYMIMPVKINLGAWIDIEKIFATDGELNYSSYSNSTVDAYFEQLKTLREPEVVSAGYNAIESILTAENPVLGMYISDDVLAVRGNVSGINRNKLYAWDPLAYFHEWGLTEVNEQQTTEEE